MVFSTFMHMKPADNKLISQLNPLLFWDTDVGKLHPDHSRRLIIERIFSLGDITDIRLAIEYYGKSTLKSELTNLNYLDPKSLNFAAKLLNIPRSSFKCYKRKPHQPQHWNS